MVTNRSSRSIIISTSGSSRRRSSNDDDDGGGDDDDNDDVDADDVVERWSGADKWQDVADRIAAMEREELLCAREHDGTLRFELVPNDAGASRVNVVALTLLTHLFRRQLPAMTTDYIKDLVFDPGNIALACISASP